MLKSSSKLHWLNRFIVFLGMKMAIFFQQVSTVLIERPSSRIGKIEILVELYLKDY